MSLLFQPITLRGLTIRNRAWVAPMCQYSVLAEDGAPTSWHLVHLGSLAAGGAGLVITEATAVEPIGRISPRDTGIWNDEQQDAWRPIVDFIHERGAAAGIQLAHAGRKGSTTPPWGFDTRGTVAIPDGGWTTVSASDLPFTGFDAPEALDLVGIDRIVTAFADAARRSVAAGFDLIEIHAAHGYLLHQFLSPASNVRTDEYGGSLENRARLLLRVVREIRSVVGEHFPLLVRFSATDYADDGWNEEQTAIVAGWAEQAGSDLVDVSSAGNVPGVSIPIGPGYQVPYAEFVREKAHVATGAVGLITEARQAENVLERGQADVILLGRELLRDPHWPLRAARELGDDIGYWPPQYLRARLA